MNKAATFEPTRERTIRAPRGKVFDAFVTPGAARRAQFRLEFEPQRSR